jgi:hypothetical protein
MYFWSNGRISSPATNYMAITIAPLWEKSLRPQVHVAGINFSFHTANFGRGGDWNAYSGVWGDSLLCWNSLARCTCIYMAIRTVGSVYAFSRLYTTQGTSYTYMHCVCPPSIQSVNCFTLPSIHFVCPSLYIPLHCSYIPPPWKSDKGCPNSHTVFSFRIYCMQICLHFWLK